MPTMPRLNKKTIAHVSAGVAAALLLAFGITQCSQKNNAQDQADNCASELNDSMVENRQKLEAAAAALDSLMQKNRVQADSIVVLNDSIDVLNDSICTLNGRLADCERSKRVSRTTPRRSSKGANTTVINLGDGAQNSGTIVVSNDPDDKNRTNITLGKDATNGGDIVVNNSGADVSIGAGNGAGADSATVAAQNQCKVIVIKRARVSYNVR